MEERDHWIEQIEEVGQISLEITFPVEGISRAMENVPLVVKNYQNQNGIYQIFNLSKKIFIHLTKTFPADHLMKLINIEIKWL